MDYINFGETKDSVSKVILGLMRTSDMRVDELTGLCRAALDEGINFFDTADCYANGRAEELLGEVFQRDSGLRDKVFLQSKCGIRNEDGITWYDFSREHIISAVEASLSRLKTDHLDSLLLHRPDALMEPEEIAEAFTKLNREGKVKNFGVSNCNPWQLELLSTLPFKLSANQVQLSVCHTPMLDEGFDVNMKWDGSTVRAGGILEYCRAKDIAVQAWSTMQYGFFEGVYINNERFPDLNRVLYRIAGEQNVSVAAVALAWILRYPGKTQAVIGTTKIDRVRESAQAVKVQLTHKQWYELYQAAGNRLP